MSSLDSYCLSASFRACLRSFLCFILEGDSEGMGALVSRTQSGSTIEPGMTPTLKVVKSPESAREATLSRPTKNSDQVSLKVGEFAFWLRTTIVELPSASSLTWATSNTHVKIRASVRSPGKTRRTVYALQSLVTSKLASTRDWIRPPVGPETSISSYFLF